MLVDRRQGPFRDHLQARKPETLPKGNCGTKSNVTKSTGFIAWRYGVTSGILGEGGSLLASDVELQLRLDQSELHFFGFSSDSVER